MNQSMDTHFAAVSKALCDGRVVPLLGAGVNLFGRPPDTAFERGRYLPSGSELATYLTKAFDYPVDEAPDLVRISQYVAIANGLGPLYDELRGLLDADYPPTPLHEFLAALPSTLRARGLPPRYQLIVTTNYDDVLERAFEAVDEPFDLVTYMADGDRRGKFLHRTPDGGVRMIDKPNEYLGISLDTRTVVMKIHGAIDRSNPDQDSYVITEDHYIDYLTRTDISSLVPAKLAAKLRRSHFLFLGYSLRDWNLRVILHRIWGEQKLSYRSWAVQLNPHLVDREFWRKRDVEILNLPLESYLASLREALEEQLAGEARP